MSLRLTRTGGAVLALAVLLGGAGQALGFAELRAGALALTAAVVAGACWAVLANRPATVTRNLATARVPEGEDLPISITVTNARRRRRPAGRLIDRVNGVAAAHGVPAVAAGDDATVALTGPPQRRGRYRLGPVELAATDPLGLALARRRVGGESQVWVHPQVHLLRPRETTHGVREGARVRSTASDGIELLQLDEYTPGDDPRRVHWATTLRQGRLMVRQPARDHRTEALVLLDTAASSYADDRQFDAAVRTAASVALSLSRGREACRLATTGGRRRPVSGAGSRRTVLLDLLAETVRRPDDPGLATYRPSGGQRPMVVVAVTGSANGDGTAPSDGVPGAPPLARHVDTLTVLRIDPGGVSVHRRPHPRRGPAVRVIAAPTSEELVRAWNASAAR